MTSRVKANPVYKYKECTNIERKILDEFKLHTQKRIKHIKTTHTNTHLT